MRPDTRRTLGWLCATWLALTGCGGGGSEAPQTETPRAGGTLVIGSPADVDGWNEYTTGDRLTFSILRRIYLPLAAPRSGGEGGPPELEPLLAESWSLSADGLELTFKLRDAEWSDGTPLRASDVEFTWRAQTSPDVGWNNASDKRFIESVRAVDDRTAVFRFSRTYPYPVADAAVGAIVPEHVFGRVPFAEWRTHDWSDVRVGSGPFLPESHRPAEELTLVRNPRYFREGRPYVDRVVVRIVPDATNLVTQAATGAVDFAEGLSPGDVRAVRDDTRVRARTYEPKYDFIGWNGRRDPFGDRRFRRAMTMALDRSALADALGGYGQVSAGPVVSASWEADPSLEPLDHDPARARELLGELGYRAGADGVLSRDGQPLRIRLITNSTNELRKAMLVRIQEQLGRIGVDVEVEALALGAVQRAVGSGNYDGWLGGWMFPGRVDFHLLFSSGGGFNLTAYRSDETDRLIEEMDRAADWKAARPALYALQRLLRDDQPYTFLYETHRVALLGARVRGVTFPVPYDPLDRLEDFWLAE